MRLREAGKFVVGFGEKKAPAGFVETCDRFETIGMAKSTERGNAKTGATVATSGSTAPKDGSTGAKQKPGRQENGKPAGGDACRREFLKPVRGAAEKARDHNGWIHTSVIGSQIRKLKPGVQYKEYGHKTLIAILETYPNEIETRGPKQRKQLRMRA